MDLEPNFDSSKSPKGLISIAFSGFVGENHNGLLDNEYKEYLQLKDSSSGSSSAL